MPLSDARLCDETMASLRAYTVFCDMKEVTFSRQVENGRFRKIDGHSSEITTLRNE